MITNGYYNMVGIALFFLHKYLTLMMEASPLPWKVQWAHHGMGFVNINGEKTD